MSAVLVMAVAVACGAGRPSADDSAFHQDMQNRSSGAEVTFDAVVTTDPVDSGGHERFDVKATTGEDLEVDHNIDLAQEVPLHAGDHVVIHGQLYFDTGRDGVHCTHAHTSSGCPYPGWIELSGQYYE